MPPSGLSIDHKSGRALPPASHCARQSEGGSFARSSAAKFESLELCPSPLERGLFEHVGPSLAPSAPSVDLAASLFCLRFLPDFWLMLSQRGRGVWLRWVEFNFKAKFSSMSQPLRNAVWSFWIIFLNIPTNIHPINFPISPIPLISASIVISAPPPSLSSIR